jgi:hypothetical protein
MRALADEQRTPLLSTAAIANWWPAGRIRPPPSLRFIFKNLNFTTVMAQNSIFNRTKQLWVRPTQQFFFSSSDVSATTCFDH